MSLMRLSGGCADLPVELREAVPAVVVGERDGGDIAREHGVSEAAGRRRVGRGPARLGGWMRKEGA